MARPTSESARDPETAALAETRSIFPGTVTKVLWTDCAGKRGVVVVEVQVENGRYLHQVTCLQEGEMWYSWTSGPAPGWLELEDPFGVVTRCDCLEPGTMAVRLSHFGAERVVHVDGQCLFQALWDVTTADGEWSWPEPTSVLVRGHWEAVAFVGLPVRTAFLVDRYVFFEGSHRPNDQWAWDALMEGVRDRPEEAWPVVLQSIEAAPRDDVLFAIAAGPLEDLVGRHADVLIDVIEAAARTSPKLRRALGGVWVAVPDTEIAERLARLADV